MDHVPHNATPPRGNYKRVSLSAKRRVVAAHDNDQDWKIVAAANGINVSTARKWINKESLTPKPRGGIRPRVLNEDIIDSIQSWVEFDTQITLQEITNRLQVDLGIEVSTSTVHRELDKRVFTYKTVHYEPLQMNHLDFKQKRQEYVRAYRQLSGQGKIPIWMDETNFNLFTSRTKARSRRGTRARSVRGGTQKGKNLHVIGAMSATNYFYCTHKRGAYKNDNANEWVRGMLRAASNHYGGLDDIVVIADNAPCHARLSVVFAEDEFRAATLLRLAPYSPMLNPIENLWSLFKANVKTLLRERLAAFMGPPPDGSTREEFRMQYLEHIAQEVIEGIEVNRLNRFALRLEYFYGRAEALDDMEVGA